MSYAKQSYLSSLPSAFWTICSSFRKPYPRAGVLVHNQGLSLLPLLEAVSGGCSSTDYEPHNPCYRWWWSKGGDSVGVPTFSVGISAPVRDIRCGRSRTRYKFRWPYRPWVIRNDIGRYVFDAALKSAFRERRRIFGATREDPLGPRRSGPKVGVVTTSISRDISTFVIGLSLSKSYRRGSVGIGSF
ncbi:hypothetical protein PCH_Pc16g07210 [Penicillium rubens Wisconsin 54-1255]|uniref:Uncharacterized protein n=1 Tax=Penicillium rubens (strain ATCC 28089 / DSM 1075 / NRRL 1951 / Wisconsin 54-1255) TaxID=500485 RepID=B6H7E0_PENRW|nr:hypothetical protein PCH_Pc16g07210 [Penicillium rubens Wisconsin 54-1255]